jgi:hypothetical protein
VTEESSTSSSASALAERNGGTTPPPDPVSFSDVARAHHRWDVAARGTAREQARDDFTHTLADFERHFDVEVVEAYWCRKEASAVALAAARAQPVGPLRLTVRRVLRRDEAPDLRIYRVTDWVTGEVRKLADLMHECDVLAIKATWGLEGFQRAVVMQWLLSVEMHILGFVESEWKRPLPVESPMTNSEGDPSAQQSQPERARRREETQTRQRVQRDAAARLNSLYLHTLRELGKIEDYYQQAGEKQARLRYVAGMLGFGVPAVAVIAVLAGVILSVFGLLELESPGVRRFYATMAAGAIGAIISVLLRMTGRGRGFTIDHEIGSVGVMRLGAFRPIIGAVFGVLFSFLVQTSLVPVDDKELTLEFFVAVAFLAGFSERWTQVVLGSAMRTIPSVGDVSNVPQTGFATSGSGASDESGT